MASHPTKLFLGIYEPVITIFLDSGEEMSEMQIVTLGTGVTEGNVYLCGNADYPYGFCTQNVTTAGVTQYGVSGLITRTAKVGDKVGIYVGTGVIKTDKLAVADIAAGDLLYAGASGANDGYFTNVAAAAPAPVGLCELSEDSEGVIRFLSKL